MILSRRLAAPLTAAATCLAAAAALTLLADHAQAATTSLCGTTQTTPVSGGAYTVQNNEWNSSASECITTDGGADFSVANSAISNSTSGAPGGYPSIFKGCHWGNCTTGSGLPIQVSTLLNPGTVTTSWNTTQTGQGAYDVAYDIWYNHTPTTPGQPNAEEMMIWLNHNGPVQPAGSVIASNVSIGGHTYNIWRAQMSSWIDVSYVMTSPATSVSNLDIGLLATDSVQRGTLSTSDYLIDLEAGFELWQGGAGLATNSYAVSVNGNGGTTPPSSPPPTSQPPTSQPPTSQPPTSPPPSTPPSTGCSATYSVTSSWPGGFQGQVTVTNNGGAATHGWTVGWTYPGDQKIGNLWNGSYTQSGEQVTVTNAAYNGVINPGAATSFGFTGTFASNDTPPTTLTCTAS
jgi:cellulose binding protein with CBM2 domain/glycosyl hydrolase family 12